jgi:hypothetical protein
MKTEDFDELGSTELAEVSRTDNGMPRDQPERMNKDEATSLHSAD